MDQRDIIANVLDSMTFKEILSFCPTDRLVQYVCCSQQYWQSRAKLFGLLDIYQRYPLLPPKIRYIWSVVMASKDQVVTPLNPDLHNFKNFQDIVIYLSHQKGLLFRGLEYLIGRFTFMERSIDFNDVGLFEYAFSLYSGAFFKHFKLPLISHALAINQQDMAHYLCLKFNIWEGYDARYSPPISISRISGSPNLIFYTAKYGSPNWIFYMAKYGQLTYPSDMTNDQEYILFLASKGINYMVQYLTGLVERREVIGIDSSFVEDRFIEILRMYSEMIHKQNIDDLAISVGSHGSWKIIESLINMVQEFMSQDQKELIFRDMIRKEIERDDVMLLHQTVSKMQLFSIGSYMFRDVEIKSVTMYQFLVNRLDIISPTDLRVAIVFGGNYSLFYKIYENVSKEEFLLIIHRDITRIKPLMLSELIKLMIRDGLEPFEMILQTSWGAPTIHPYTYDLLRSLGMKPNIDLIGHILKDVKELGLFPYLKMDVEMS